MAATPLMQRRYDRGGELLRASFRRASDGALLCEGIPVREQVLVYRDAAGKERRELVSRQAVLDTARTIARGPLTLNHPAEGFVTPDTFGRLGVGDVDGEVLIEEDAQGTFAKVKMAVRRRDALDAIDAGLDELSPGYDVKLDETPGVHPIFGAFDAIQVGRDGNHLALVPKGRGDEVVLRADSGDAVQVRVATRTIPAGSTRTPREDSYMKPSLVRLLALLGVRNDNEDAAIAAGIDAVETAQRGRSDAAARAPRIDAALKALGERVATMTAATAKRGDGKAMDAADFTAAKTACDAVMQACDALTAACQGMGEGAQPMLDAATATKNSAAAVGAALDAAMQAAGQAAAAQGELGTMKADAKAKADAAELTRLQGVAAKVGVKHDGLDLGKLRVAIAKTRIDSITDATPAPYLDGVLALIEKDTGARSDARYDFARRDGKPEPKPGERTDGAADPRLDEFYNPGLAAADAARTANAQGAR